MTNLSPANPSKRMIAVVSDLMFTVKIQEAAKRTGLNLTFVKSGAQALAEAKQGAALVILDLNNATANPLEVIEQLKADPATRSISLLGYVSHVQTDLKQAAEARGCDVVMPRSAFSHNLPAILRRYAEPASAAS